MKNSSFFFCFYVVFLPKIVYRQGFMLHFLSNGNSNETGVFSPFLQKCQRSSIYGAFRTFYTLQVLDITDFWGNIFRYLRISFLICRNASTAQNQFAIKAREFESHRLRQKSTSFDRSLSILLFHSSLFTLHLFLIDFWRK